MGRNYSGEGRTQMAVQLYDPPSLVVSLGNNKARKITHLHKH